VTPIRVLLADDHSILRAGLKTLLDAEPDIEVVGEARDGEDCVRKVAELEPEIVLLDINMPGLNGLEALDELKRRQADCHVLVLTMIDDPSYMRQVLALGGVGYVLKQAAGEELLSAIRTVHDGGVFLHPHHARHLADADSAGNRAAFPGGSGSHEGFDSLSPREAEVFRLVALGFRNKEIAEKLFVSVKTVETYKARMMSKLDVGTRAALVRLALELGVLQGPVPRPDL
jgi:DNA-binding NarL/FixJ family response regulator